MAAEANRKLHGRIWEAVHRLGRAPWVVGGDWNLHPNAVAVPTLTRGMAHEPAHSTTDGASVIDWFLTASQIAEACSTQVLTEAPIAVHRPVVLQIG